MAQPFRGLVSLILAVAVSGGVMAQSNCTIQFCQSRQATPAKTCCCCCGAMGGRAMPCCGKMPAKTSDRPVAANRAGALQQALAIAAAPHLLPAVSVGRMVPIPQNLGFSSQSTLLSLGCALTS